MKVVVISPHPDDETLGSCGTLLRYKREGNQIYWINITSMQQEDGYSEDKIATREREIETVKKLYEMDGFYNLKLKPSRLDEYLAADIILKLNSVINKIEPQVVILPHYNDAHSDHKTVFEWGYACTKNFRNPFIKKVLAMEIISETDFGKPVNPFRAQLYVDITQEMELKVKILSTYKSELGTHPFPRSIEGIKALAKVRGAAAGVTYAECFELIKEIY